MKDCSSYRRLILQSLHDDLPLEDQEMLSRHLEQCAACRGEQEEFRNVYSLTGIDDGEGPPGVDELLSVTMQAISREGAAASVHARRNRWFKAAAIAAVLVLFVFGALFLIQFLGEKDTEPAGLMTLAEPDFDLPDITLREVTLASFTENEEDVFWVNDFERARSLAAYSSAPILYQVYDKHCPLARRMEKECFTDAKFVKASRNFICIRRTHENHEYEVEPEVSPAFFIIHPDGEVVDQFGGDMDLETLLVELAKYAGRGGWISYRKFERYRKILEDAAEAYHKRSFCRVQEHLECFSCEGCDCGMKHSGISKEFKRIKEAMQSYFDSKHAFARKLVRNGELDRARAFYGRMLVEFEGLSITAVLREELEALTP